MLKQELWGENTSLAEQGTLTETQGKNRGFMNFGIMDRQLRKSIRLALDHLERKLEK